MTDNVKKLETPKAEKAGPDLAEAKKAIENEKRGRAEECMNRIKAVCAELNCALGALPKFLPDGRIAADPVVQPRDAE